MSDFYVEYWPDFLFATEPETDGPYCAAGHQMATEEGHFSCTRMPAHDGRHEAGIGGQLIAASWERETVTVTTETPQVEA